MASFEGTAAWPLPPRNGGATNSGYSAGMMQSTGPGTGGHRGRYGALGNRSPRPRLNDHLRSGDLACLRTVGELRGRDFWFVGGECDPSQTVPFGGERPGRAANAAATRRMESGPPPSAVRRRGATRTVDPYPSRGGGYDAGGNPVFWPATTDVRPRIARTGTSVPVGWAPRIPRKSRRELRRRLGREREARFPLALFMVAGGTMTDMRICQWQPDFRYLDFCPGSVLGVRTSDPGFFPTILGPRGRPDANGDRRTMMGSEFRCR